MRGTPSVTELNVFRDRQGEKFSTIRDPRGEESSGRSPTRSVNQNRGRVRIQKNMLFSGERMGDPPIESVVHWIHLVCVPKTIASLAGLGLRSLSETPHRGRWEG